MWPRRYGRRKAVGGVVKPRQRNRGVFSWSRAKRSDQASVVPSGRISTFPTSSATSDPLARRPPRRYSSGNLFYDTHRTVAVREVRAAGRGGQAVGCWDWSAATIARRTLPAHRPGRLPGAFIACANGNLVLEGASRLDAFSAYPVPTWLPGDALSRTTGTPEVGPPQSSRTRGDAPQVSCAHGR